jgi:hypothetical protein
MLSVNTIDDSDGTSAGNRQFEINLANFLLSGGAAAVPEPATLAVFGALAVGAFGVRRRAKASA